MKSKNIFLSKTFWINAVGVASLLVPGLPINAETLGLVLAGLNVANRLLTNGPVHVLKDAASEP